LVLPDAVRVVGPAPLARAPHGVPGDAEEEPEYRTLLFFPYAMAAQITAAMRSLKASNAARRIGSPVQVRCDGVDVL
jgi:primosomal protein N' (replication factor Y)